MHNMMQHWPLLVGRIIDHAARYHPNRAVISRDTDGVIRSSTWSDVHLGARKVTQALRRMGIKPGDVVGVMAWNTRRMLDVWYGVPGAGAVLHTLNPRLFADQLVYVINHAENKILLVDADLLPVIANIRDRLETVEHVIVMAERDAMPATTIEVMCFGDWVGDEDGDTRSLRLCPTACRRPHCRPNRRSTSPRLSSLASRRQ